MKNKVTIFTMDDMNKQGDSATLDQMSFYHFKSGRDKINKSELIIFVDTTEYIPGGIIKVLKDRGIDFSKSKKGYETEKEDKVSNGLLVRTPVQSQIDYLYKILMDSKHIPITDAELKTVIITILRGWYGKEHINLLNSIRDQYSHIVTLGTLS